MAIVQVPNVLVLARFVIRKCSLQLTKEVVSRSFDLKLGAGTIKGEIEEMFPRVRRCRVGQFLLVLKICETAGMENGTGSQTRLVGVTLVPAGPIKECLHSSPKGSCFVPLQPINIIYNNNKSLFITKYNATYFVESNSKLQNRISWICDPLMIDAAVRCVEKDRVIVKSSSASWLFTPKSHSAARRSGADFLKIIQKNCCNKWRQPARPHTEFQRAL